MHSLQVLREYRDAIYELCSALPQEARDFFNSMEERGIDILSDTIENRIENLNIINDHCGWINNISNYLQVNQNLEYDRELCEALPESLILTPLQVFEILITRSSKTQEEIIKLTCEQHLMSRILRTLEEKDATEFLSIVENNKVDMANVSKLLSLHDWPHLSDNDADLFEYYYDSKRRILKGFRNIYDTPLDVEQTILSKSPLIRWLFETLFTNEEFNNSNIMDLVLEKIKRFQEFCQHFEEGDEKIFLDVLEAFWSFYAKRLIITMANLPEAITTRIRETLAPFYFRPLIERYEKEWEDIQRDQRMFLDHIENEYSSENEYGTQSEDFILPENFFAQKNDSLSFHMILHPDVIKAGVKKFEKFLQALASEGYVDKSALPILAYRLTGCGTPFGEEIITWHKEPKVIRHIIANMHEEGSNWVSKLDKYFIDEDGDTFLNKITAAQARNIKKLYIYKHIIKPYYGNVTTLSKFHNSKH